jgi:DUF4097 and DUF4098 domain-containing protein YvlB
MRKTGWTHCFFLLALTGSLGFADEWKRNYAVSGKPDLRIDVTDGEVTVHSWDRNEISALVTTQGWRISPSEVRVTDRQAADRVEIDVRTPRINVNFGFNRHSVHIELQVPRELRAQIHSGDGRISARDLKGEIHLSTGDGSIEADAIDGIFEARTGDGHIKADGPWDGLELDTKDGSIEADARSGSKMAGRWRVETGDGHVTLRLPDNFAAELDAHTGDGKITVDFPMTVQGAFRSSEFRGKLNGGGGTLVVRTGDGPIRVSRL